MVRILWGCIFSMLSFLYILVGYGVWATREQFQAQSPMPWTYGIYFFLIPGLVLLTGVIALFFNQKWSTWVLRLGLIGCTFFPVSKLQSVLSNPEVGQAGVVSLVAPLVVLVFGFISTFLISRSFDNDLEVKS